ncbi:DUF2140 family protein [Alicyclobacillus tolerans]|uniref:DUF2140 family protein n=1 Tax=Alicyclobacillus tolerans TaxID=90970 RepID=UPI003B78A44D
MIWKRAFVVLLSINLLAAIGLLVWVTSFPKPSASTVPLQSIPSGTPANIQMSIGDEAINAYLAYDLPRQKDLNRFLQSAKVNFSNNWKAQLDILFLGRVIPFDMTFLPVVENGNLNLQLEQSSMGGVGLPNRLLFLFFERMPWPNWIQLQSQNDMIQVNLSERPQSPFRIRALAYNPRTRLLTLEISIFPALTSKIS